MKFAIITLTIGILAMGISVYFTEMTFNISNEALKELAQYINSGNGNDQTYLILNGCKRTCVGLAVLRIIEWGTMILFLLMLLVVIIHSKMSNQSLKGRM